MFSSVCLIALRLLRAWPSFGVGLFSVWMLLLWLWVGINSVDIGLACMVFCLLRFCVCLWLGYSVVNVCLLLTFWCLWVDCCCCLQLWFLDFELRCVGGFWCCACVGLWVAALIGS